MKIYLSLFLLVSFQVIGMDAKDLVKKIHHVYAKKELLEYKCTYELFKGHSGKEILERYEGYVYKNKTNCYQKINSSEMIYTTDYFIKIDHEDEVIAYNNPVKGLTQEVNLNDLLNECYQIKLDEKFGKYLLLFYFKDSYKYPYNLIKIEVNKQNLLLNQIDFYYSIKKDFSLDITKQDWDFPHLRVKFLDYNELPEEKNYLFELNRYLEKNKKTYIPSKRFYKYQFYNRKTN